MTAGTATAPAPSQGHATGQGQAAAPVLAPWPFPVGVLGTENASDYDETKTMTSGTVKFPDVKVEPDGWLRGLWFDFTMSVTANVTNVTAFAADGPFNAIDTVLFRDTGGEQIFGPFNGYDWENSNKFGGYHAQGDPRADPDYSVTTGSGSTGGSFHFNLYLPLEISAADSLGAVENRSENSIYRVELTMAASTTVYSTAPSALGSMEVKVIQDAYTEPVAAMSLSGRAISQAPPSPGTLQYWKQEDDSGIVASSHSTLITNGIGNGYRNIVLKAVNGSSVRTDSMYPDPLELTLGTTRVRNLYFKLWRTKMARDYQYTSTSADSANGPENGVRLLNFNKDVGIKPGDEARRRYLRTKTGNTFKLKGTWGSAGTLYITSNYVVPRGNDFSQVVA